MERREAFQTGKGVRLQLPAGKSDCSDEKDSHSQQNEDYRNVKDCEADFPEDGREFNQWIRGRRPAFNWN